MDVTCAGPQTSLMVCSPGVFDRPLASFGKGCTDCLACTQASQNFEGSLPSSISNPVTNPFLCSVSSPVIPMCPYSLCQVSQVFFVLATFACSGSTHLARASSLYKRLSLRPTPTSFLVFVYSLHIPFPKSIRPPLSSKW